MRISGVLEHPPLLIRDIRVFSTEKSLVRSITVASRLVFSIFSFFILTLIPVLRKPFCFQGLVVNSHKESACGRLGAPNSPLVHPCFTASLLVQFSDFHPIFIMYPYYLRKLVRAQKDSMFNRKRDFRTEALGGQQIEDRLNGARQNGQTDC